MLLQSAAERIDVCAACLIHERSEVRIDLGVCRLFVGSAASRCIGCVIVAAGLRPRLVDRAASCGQEWALHVTLHALHLAQALQPHAVRFDLTSHARLLLRTQLARHEIEDAEDLDGANVDGEIAAPVATVLARERVSVGRSAQACIVPATRALVGGDRSKPIDFGASLLPFLRRRFVVPGTRPARFPTSRSSAGALHGAVPQRVPMLRARRRILNLFGFRGDFSLDSRVAGPERLRRQHSGTVASGSRKRPASRQWEDPMSTHSSGGRRESLDVDSTQTMRAISAVRALRLAETEVVCRAARDLGPAGQSGHDAAPRGLRRAPALRHRGET